MSYTRMFYELKGRAGNDTIFLVFTSGPATAIRYYLKRGWKLDQLFLVPHFATHSRKEEARANAKTAD